MPSFPKVAEGRGVGIAGARGSVSGQRAAEQWEHKMLMASGLIEIAVL